jgi:hypothetical protein
MKALSAVPASTSPLVDANQKPRAPCKPAGTLPGTLKARA